MKFQPRPEDLKAYASAAGYTGSQLAEICDVNPRTIRRWIGGDIPMPYSAWVTLNFHGKVYRAAVWVRPDRQGHVVLTGREHAGMSEDELFAEAEKEAWNADLLTEDPEDEARMLIDNLLDGLEVWYVE